MNLLHIPRYFNEDATDMAQKVSGFRINEEDSDVNQATFRKLLPVLVNRLPLVNISNIKVHDDWRKPIVNYLSGLVGQPNQSIRLKSINYIKYAGMLFKRGSDGILLDCLSKFEGIEAITQVHEGLSVAH